MKIVRGLQLQFVYWRGSVLLPEQPEKIQRHLTFYHLCAFGAYFASFAIIVNLLLFFLPLASPLFAQSEGYNHPELNWFTIETEHFFVHFHQGADRTAREVARVAEHIYGPITTLYRHQPDSKVHIVVKDYEDYSNGAAYYYDNKIEIWATPMDFELRGTHPWVLNVVTHEFTHIVSLQVAMKFTRHIPAFYLQYFNYERERRPDVLYGFYTQLASFPLAGTVIPPWFAEGVAQYQAPNTAYDFWDTHRDMILRTAVIENKMLSYKEMCVFGKNSLGNEMVYNSGFALVSYIAKNYGRQMLSLLARKMNAPWRLSFNAALKSVLGKSETELYREWRRFLRHTYLKGLAEVLANPVEGRILVDEGIGNFYPVWSPDGKKFAYLSNRGAEYLSQTSLWLYDTETGKAKLLKAGVAGSIAWSPNGKVLVYARKHRVDHYGSHKYDLYLFDLKGEKEIRLTWGELRARNPAWSPDGEKIVFVLNADGTNNLAIYDLVKKQIIQITNFHDGRQIFRPCWSPTGDLIVFDTSVQHHGRQIATIRPDGSKFRILLPTRNDARNPTFSSDGKKIYFAWDKSGIFNIYELTLQTKKIAQLTNVIGGAFMPAIHPKSGLVYSLYTAEGYKIAWIKKIQKIGKSPSYLARLKLPRTEPPTSLLSWSKQEKSGNEEGGQKFDNPDTVRLYREMYSPMVILPRVIYDYNRINNSPLKLGAYFYSSEVLERYSILAGVATNRVFDWDVFGIVEYKKFLPTVFLEVYNQVRHTSEKNYKFKYHLMEADFGLGLKLSDSQNLRSGFTYSRYHARLKTTIQGQEVKFGYTYFIGRDFFFRWKFKKLRLAPDGKINPVGRRLSLHYEHHWDKFIQGFKVNATYGTIMEVYKNYDYNKLGIEWQEYLPLPWKHTLQIGFQGGYIDCPVDSFFHLFAGGLVGMKGYPYYSIEGRKLAIGSVTYRFPLFRHLNLRLTPFHFDKIYLGIFADYGNAWVEDKLDLSQFKRDVGLQLRFDIFVFYNYPIKLFFNTAYGLDQFSNNWGQKYGKEFRYYFGLTFDYLD